MKESFRRYEIGRLQLVYGDFLQDRQLSPEQSTQFLDLLFDQESRDMEDGTRFLSGDQDAGPSPLTKAEMDREMKALLGDDAFEKFEAYDRTTTERLAVAEVREELNRTSAPLEEEQADTLLQIMIEERERTPLTAFDPRVPGTSRDKFLAVVQGDNAEQFYHVQMDLNQRILSRTGTILSPDQVRGARIPPESVPLKWKRYRSRWRAKRPHQARDARELGGVSSRVDHGVYCRLMKFR